MTALSFAQVQEIRECFAALAEWTRLPIPPDQLEGRQILSGRGAPSLLRFAAPMLSPEGELGDFSCYAPSLRRFAIFPSDPSAKDAAWRVSENTIGVMVNPTKLPPADFARECYRYLLARESGARFKRGWLDAPRLWPERLTRPEDLKVARRAIPNLRMTETVLRARLMFGGSLTARAVPGLEPSELDWRTQDGDVAELIPAADSLIGTVLTWRLFLDGFLSNPVPFTRDADGRRADPGTRGALHPAPLLIVGVVHTGRTDWDRGEEGERLIDDLGAWSQVLESLASVPGEDLRRAGLAPRTVRAMRSGRPAAARNADAALGIASGRARVAAGLVRDRGPRCIAPECEEALVGRQRTFCSRHGAYPGSRRREWREAAGR